jgi:thioredoxin 1
MKPIFTVRHNTCCAHIGIGFVIILKKKMDHFRDVIQSDKPVLVDFFATWCGPCKMMTPVLHEVKAAMGDQVTILKIDVDKNPEVSGQFQVQGVPTLIIFRQGKVKWRQSGVVPAKELQQVLKNV